jgi:hypothetical protein
MEAIIVKKQNEEMIGSNVQMPLPEAVLANPTVQAVDLVWDTPRDSRITAIEVNWKKSSTSEWQSQMVPGERVRIDNLSDGESYDFRIRSVGKVSQSDWSTTQSITAGAAKGLGITEGIEGLSIGLMLELFYYGVLHALTSP